MNLKKEIKDLKREINKLVDKASCRKCGKTLFMYDGNYVYVKCKHCKEISQFLLDKKVV
jgi:phage FluMu protein Com